MSGFTQLISYTRQSYGRNELRGWKQCLCLVSHTSSHIRGRVTAGMNSGAENNACVWKQMGRCLWKQNGDATRSCFCSQLPDSVIKESVLKSCCNNLAWLFVLFLGRLYEDKHSAGLWGRYGRVLLQPELDAGGHPARVPQRGHLQSNSAGGEQPRVRHVIPLPACDVWVSHTHTHTHTHTHILQCVFLVYMKWGSYFRCVIIHSPVCWGTKVIIYYNIIVVFLS